VELLKTRRRSCQVGRVELSDEEATALTRTKLLYASMVVVFLLSVVVAGPELGLVAVLFLGYPFFLAVGIADSALQPGGANAKKVGQIFFKWAIGSGGSYFWVWFANQF
jgi:hypothetical protein